MVKYNSAVSPRSMLLLWQVFPRIYSLSLDGSQLLNGTGISPNRCEQPHAV